MIAGHGDRCEVLAERRDVAGLERPEGRDGAVVRRVADEHLLRVHGGEFGGRQVRQLGCGGH